MKRAVVPTTGIQRVMQGKLDLMWSNERPDWVNWEMKDKKQSREEEGKLSNCPVASVSQGLFMRTPRGKIRNSLGMCPTFRNMHDTYKSLPSKFLHKLYNKGLTHICEMIWPLHKNLSSKQNQRSITLSKLKKRRGVLTVCALAHR